MGKARDWKNDGESVGVNLIEKDGDTLICEKDGFIFKIHRSNWPPAKLSPVQCFTPTDYFKYQVKQLHGETYDLSKVVYTGADDNVVATCGKHGDFEIAAKYFKSIRGCPKCGDESAGLKSRSNTNDFVEKAKSINGNFYDYSLVNYETARTEVTLICPIHGHFQVTPERHLVGRGCKVCGRIRIGQSKRLTQEEVVSRFRQKHGDTYDYSDVVYEGDAHGHLSIICKTHGRFLQSYANHNSGEGCPSCAKEMSPRFKSGFIARSVANENACVYLIKCYNETEVFFKIGITTKEVSRRFAGFSSMPYDYELLHKYHSDGESIWNLETQLHRHYKDVKYLPLISFGGMYECFSHIDLQDYKSVLLDKINSS